MTKQLFTRLPVDEHRKLFTYCRTHNISRSELIKQLIDKMSNIKTRSIREVIAEAKEKTNPNIKQCTFYLKKNHKQKIIDLSITNNASFSEIARSLLKPIM